MKLLQLMQILPFIRPMHLLQLIHLIHSAAQPQSVPTPPPVGLHTANVMKTLREKVMRTGVTKQRRKRRMKKYLMKCFCTKHFSSRLSLGVNMS